MSAEDLEKRSHERLRFAGSARLVVDGPTGLCTTFGKLADLSMGGCALRVNQPLSIGTPGRVWLEIGTISVWLPIMTRWVRGGGRNGWLVGCQFDRPTHEKLTVVRHLLHQRRSLVG